MKTRVLLLLVWVFAISGLKLSANPVPYPPFIHINELIFDKDGNWTIELNRHFMSNLSISTTSGEAKIIGGSQLTDGYLQLITQADLDKPLSINIEGDSITIGIDYGDSNYWDYSSLLCFGNHPSATVASPKEGQSIVLTGDARIAPYSLCNNPTIGKRNGDEGIYATIKGKIYSADENLITNKKLYLRTNILIDYNFQSEEWPLTLCKDYFEINDKGEFSVDVFAAKYTKGLYLYWYLPNEHYQGDLKEIDLNLQPKDTVICDLYVEKDYYYSLEEAQSSESLIKISPNPVGKDKVLNYEIDLPVNSLNIIAEIYSLSGNLLLSQRVEENTGTINVSPLAKGNYILKFRGEKGDQYSTKILIE